ncbi:hypothetical protein GCM10009735_48600 [Actinomadura chokoriensis]
MVEVVVHDGAELAHRRGRRDPVPDDVADDQGGAAVRQRDRVEPVAAGGLGAGEQVAAADREAGQDRQARREELPLQDVDDVAGLGVPLLGLGSAALRGLPIPDWAVTSWMIATSPVTAPPGEWRGTMTQSM